jgi:glycosyltransferase involved in cell wall biosynthesis
MPVDKPLLSVILPAYNVEKYVSEAIQSILCQTFQNFELLIADDGSIDSTKSILDSYALLDSRIILLHNSTNQGKTSTVNRLFTMCRGAYVTIHDADDISHHTRFNKQVTFLETNKDIGMCGTSFNFITKNGGVFQKIVMKDDYDAICNDIIHESQFHGPTIVFRKSLLNTISGREIYRSFFRDYNEDCDFAIRIIEKFKAINLTEVLYNYRIVPGSLSKNLNARKKCMYPMLVHFHRQRVRKGEDDLMSGREELANIKLRKLMRKYEYDSSLIFRESAAFQMYFFLYKNAIKDSLRAIVAEPLRLVNYRTLFYCVRKTITRSR